MALSYLWEIVAFFSFQWSFLLLRKAKVLVYTDGKTFSTQAGFAHAEGGYLNIHH